MGRRRLVGCTRVDVVGSVDSSQLPARGSAGKACGCERVSGGVDRDAQPDGGA